MDVEFKHILYQTGNQCCEWTGVRLCARVQAASYRWTEIMLSSTTKPTEAESHEVRTAKKPDGHTQQIANFLFMVLNLFSKR